MSPAVSVIIPTFNRAAMLREAIETVFAQGHDDLEVIVIDDGSTDSTREMVATTFGGDERVRYHYQANAGASTARNTGLDLSRGDYIAFLDSDDAWQPWHLRLQLAALERHAEIGFIWTNVDFVNGLGEITAESALPRLLSAYGYFPLDELFSTSAPLSELGIEVSLEYRDCRLYIGDIFSAMIVGNLVMPSSVVMRRALLDRVGRFDERLVRGEDHQFFLRASREGPAGYADIPSIRYRVGLPDQRTAPAMGLEIAKAYLGLLDATLARDADRITLPASMIREARARAHEWAGDMALLSGSRTEARAHLSTAFRARPRLRTLATLAATLLPAAAFRLLLRVGGQAIGLLRRAIGPRVQATDASQGQRG